METKTVRLGDFATFVNEKCYLNEASRNTYVSTENLKPNRLGVFFPITKLPRTNKVNTFAKGDILIANIRPYFKKIWHANIAGTHSTDVLNIRSNSKQLLQSYLAVVLSDDRFFDYMMATSKGTKMPRGDKKAIMDFKFELPSFKDQIIISDSISIINQKIELNQQINKNLLQMMETKWRKQFEGLDANQGHFTDLADVVAGGTPSKKQSEYFGGNIAWITPKDMSKTTRVFIEHGTLNITKIGLNNSSAKLIPKGTILFSSRAPIGYIGIAANPVSTNQGFKSLVPKRKEFTEYLYFLLKRLTPLIENIASGSTFKEISGAGMKSVDFPLPTSDMIEAFHHEARSLFDLIKCNEKQSQYLNFIRNLILPKLLSGDINLSGIEEAIKNA
ncbi:restriction endonuclease subunit S [Secundilactobacillus silagincola]|uniref:Restriction endonuclease subunit S n=1 Tax=Secundilactobacillus silagincola TaxID=1714681 RepID=A0A1Z5J5L1_9LACO|nr:MULTISPECIES: restriction endonuclease subunit S [Lactobacillaceae]PJE48420.1 hypothetical protein BSQ36_10465 [Pediococcus damnosus]GAX09108.1 restriction endonuclease subunit S [Secundilactobacillus silagincola]